MIGRSTMARISASRCFSPVDRWATARSMMSSGKRRFRQRVTTSARVASVKCSPAVAAHHPATADTSMTRRRQSGADMPSRSTPSSETLPSPGSRSARRRSRSVFPAPDAPMTATHSPERRSNDTGPMRWLRKALTVRPDPLIGLRYASHRALRTVVCRSPSIRYEGGSDVRLQEGISSPCQRHRRLAVDQRRIEHRHGNIPLIEQHPDLRAAEDKAVRPSRHEPLRDADINLPARLADDLPA